MKGREGKGRKKWFREKCVKKRATATPPGTQQPASSLASSPSHTESQEFTRPTTPGSTPKTVPRPVDWRPLLPIGGAPTTSPHRKLLFFAGTSSAGRAAQFSPKREALGSNRQWKEKREATSRAGKWKSDFCSQEVNLQPSTKQWPIK